jgi:hypothetical protein
VPIAQDFYVVTWGKAPCKRCGAAYLASSDEPAGLCFGCNQQHNPFAAKGVRMSADAEGEDVRDPRRRAQGTAHINLGLPGVSTVVGTRPDGTPKTAYRGITHNELPTKRARRNYAERNGMTMLDAPKRAVGGR